METSSNQAFQIELKENKLDITWKENEPMKSKRNRHVVFKILGMKMLVVGKDGQNSEVIKIHNNGAKEIHEEVSKYPLTGSIGYGFGGKFGNKIFVGYNYIANE